MKKLLLSIGLLLFPFAAIATAELAGQTVQHFDLTSHWVGYLSIAIFVLAYLLVMAE